MFTNKFKNKLAQQASVNPVTYYIEPRIRSRITVFDLNYDIDADDIADNIRKYRSLHSVSNSSAVKAWHSGWHIHHDTTCFDQLIKIVEDRVLHSLDQTMLREVKCVESWAIIYNKGDGTARHKHSDQQYSAVYYAKADQNTSPLQFEDYLQITPKSGMLVCFPGWIRHSVPKLENDEERICMSFNLNVLMTVPTRVNHE